MARSPAKPQEKAEDAQRFLDKQAEMLRNRIDATHLMCMKLQVRLSAALSPPPPYSLW